MLENGLNNLKRNKIMKQTAVEFLEKEITEIMSYLEEDGFYAMQGVKDKLFGEKNIIQQAKEMEKEQIKTSFTDGFLNNNKNSEQYYNETFKNK